MMHHNMQDVINENKRLVLEGANLQAQLDESNKLIDWLLIASPE
jgi:regulator of replication initiation timing